MTARAASLEEEKAHLQVDVSELQTTVFQPSDSDPTSNYTAAWLRITDAIVENVTSLHAELAATHLDADTALANIPGSVPSIDSREGSWHDQGTICFHHQRTHTLIPVSASVHAEEGDEGTRGRTSANGSDASTHRCFERGYATTTTRSSNVSE